MAKPKKKLYGQTLLVAWNKYCDGKAEYDFLRRSGWVFGAGKNMRHDTIGFSRELSRAMKAEEKARKLREARKNPTIHQVKASDPIVRERIAEEVPQRNISSGNPSASKKCALYLIKDLNSNDIKIGITNNLDSRFQAIKRDYNVGELKLLDSTWFSKRSDAELFEKEIHILYQVLISSKRGGQEWFSLSNIQVKYLQQLFRRKEKEEVFNARTTITKVWGMTSQEYEKERQRVFWIYFLRPFILLFPILLIIYGGLGPRIETIMLWIFSLIFCSFIGTIFSGKIQRYKLFYRTYGEDGNALTADFPIKQYRRLNLWKEEKIFINDKKITSVEHIPEKISPYFPKKKL